MSILPFKFGISPSSRADAHVRKCSTEDLKRMWDDWDPFNDPGHFLLEAIHAEMNRRGEGEYVAV